MEDGVAGQSHEFREAHAGGSGSPLESLLHRDLFELAGQVLDEYPDATAFEDFGPYQIQATPLGRGGMGEVFLAKDQTSGRSVAIKFLQNVWLAPGLKERFAREIRMLARLEHPFIARLYDAGIHPSGTPYFAMEYVEGKPLDEYCRERRCSLDERLRLFRSVCEGVRYAHSLLIVHLDLKPSNILVKPDGTPKLLDFGIARQIEDPDLPANPTRLETGFTTAFAAPEQFQSGPVGVYTDVYALGAILFQLLTGRLPHDVEKCTPAQAELIVTRDEQPEKPSSAVKARGGEGESTNLPKISKAAWSDLDVLCLKALKRDVPRRYHSVVEMVQDIDHFFRGEPLKARPDAPGYRAAKFFRRHRRSIGVSAAILTLFAGLTALYGIRLAKARDAALTEAARTRRIQRFMLRMFGSDYDSAPPADLRVVTMLDRGVREAQILKKEPAVQSALYQTLGDIYQQLGDLDRADGLLTAGLETSKATFGADSPEVANSLIALSMLRVNQAKFAEAEKFAREAVAIDERRLPSARLEEARALTGLGAVLQHRGALPEAKNVLERAVRIQTAGDAEKSDVVEALTYLANTQHSLGDNLAARPLAQRVLALDRQIYGDRHPAIAEDLSNLEGILDDLGEYPEAERHGREALGIVTTWYGRDHTESALMSVGLARTLIYERNYHEAIALLSQALATEEHTVGKAHPYVGITLNWRGTAALRSGQLERARDDFQRMSEVFVAVYGPQSSQAAIALSRAGELKLAEQRYPEAEQIFRQCAERLSRTLSPGDVRTGVVRVELGDALLHEQRYAEAETQLRAGYSIVTNPSSASLESAALARRDLASVYQALRLPDKAAEFQGERPATGHTRE